MPAAALHLQVATGNRMQDGAEALAIAWRARVGARSSLLELGPLLFRSEPAPLYWHCFRPSMFLVGRSVF